MIIASEDSCLCFPLPRSLPTTSSLTDAQVWVEEGDSQRRRRCTRTATSRRR